MKKALFAISALALVAMTGCNKESVSTTPGENYGDEIRLSTSLLSIDTKGAYMETQPSAESPLLARVYVSDNQSFDGDEYSGQNNGYIKFESTSATGFCTANGTATPKYYEGDSHLWLYGLYPATGWTFETQATSASIVIDGKSDVMVSPIQECHKADNGKNLAFEHKLTLLKIQAKAQDEASKEIWGKVKSITLTKALGKDLRNKVKVTTKTSGPLDAATYETETGKTTLPIYDWSSTNSTTSAAFTNNVLADKEIVTVGEGENDDETKATPFGYVICEAVTAAASEDEYTLEIETERGEGGSTTTIQVSLNETGGTEFTENTAGMAFTINLNFAVNQITCTASVAPWTSGGETDVDIDDID